ncbi:MAG: hypothetical protein IPJ43_08595 [Saprospiraceae bacterium]|nr:hypothetical protein [Saprospiraceae bacterium]
MYSKEAELFIKNLNPKYLVSTYPVNVGEAMLLKAGNNSIFTTTIIHFIELG